MNSIRHYLFAFLLLASVTSVTGQGTGVRTEYLKDSKNTKVETNLLYVVNLPEQFMQLQLTTTFKGDKLVSSPSKVEVTVFSFSKKPQFKSGGDRVVMITADGEEIKLGTLNSTVFEGETKNGIDSFYPADNPNLGMRVPVPQSAQIRSSGDLNGTSMELMLLSVKSEQFLKIAKAATLEMRIGTIALALNDRHREIIRNFADSITPR